MRFRLTETVVRYAVYGLLGGVLLPLLATLVDISARGLPLHPFSALFVQTTQPLHWLIDAAPLAFGFMGGLIGVRQQALAQLSQERSQAGASQIAQLEEANEALRSRAAQLELIVRIVRRVSAILDRRKLITSVVEIIGDTLDYYHVHVYLYDERGEYLVINAGTGEAGRSMALQGHRIPHGKGLVGRAAESNLPVVVPDVSQDRGWLPNPLLPETRAEIAVPIRRAERVLGVLDVQHDVVGGLDQNDAEVLQTIADQIAVALENAQLYARVQRRVDREVLLNSITQKIQGTADVDDALQVAVRELGRALNGAETSVRVRGGGEAKGEQA